MLVIFSYYFIWVFKLFYDVMKYKELFVLSWGNNIYIVVIVIFYIFNILIFCFFMINK